MGGAPSEIDDTAMRARYVSGGRSAREVAIRHDKAAKLIALARALAGSAEGLTLDEMAARVDVDRRTAERMRDALMELFPALEAVADPPTRRFRIPAGLDGFMVAPTVEELAALVAAATELQARGATGRARALRTLEAKILAALRAPIRRRLAPDLEALLQAEAIAVQAGPRPAEDPEALAAIREALMAGRSLRFAYGGGGTPGRVREVAPLGLLFGRNAYLVAAELGGGEPRTWRLDRLSGVEMGAQAAPRAPGFDLQAYADRSFGIYQDAQEDVVLRFTPAAAESAARWRFHAVQTVVREDDGAATVRFRASGMRELAWHLITWGADVAIVEPPRLRAALVEILQTALDAHQISSPLVGEEAACCAEIGR